MIPRATLRSFFFLSLLAPLPCSAFKFCNVPRPQGGPQLVSFGVVQVPADAPVGQVLATRETTAWNSEQARFCFKYTRNFSLGTFAAPALGDGVHGTNVPGVGIRIRFHVNGGEYLLPHTDSHSSHSTAYDTAMLNARFTVELVKTGPVGEGGRLTPGTLARAGYENKGVMVWVDLVDAQVQPQRPTCAFVSRQVVFNLGKVDGGTLAAEGHSHWATQQLVSTGCSQATQMLMTFAGPADEADPSLFRLNGGDAAKGVAVEVRSDHLDRQAIPNSPVPVVLPAWPEGRAYGFRARYRSTGRALAPGSANANITVNVAYR
jgi:type 1 fimbria pilin